MMMVVRVKDAIRCYLAGNPDVLHKALRLIDGQRPVAGYAEALGVPDATELFRDLQWRGLIAIARRGDGGPAAPKR